jgi:hypothetical protein
MMPKYTRRTALSLATGSLAGASLAALGHSEAAVAADGDVFVGRVVSKPEPGALLVAVTGGGQCTVAAPGSAYITRGVSGVQASLDAFYPGEEIVCRGSVVDGRCEAIEVQSLYREFSATFRGMESGGRVQTSRGVLEVAGDVPAVDQVRSLRPGDSVRAQVWLDPERSRPLLVALSAD